MPYIQLVNAVSGQELTQTYKLLQGIIILQQWWNIYFLKKKIKKRKMLLKKKESIWEPCGISSCDSSDLMECLFVVFCNTHWNFFGSDGRIKIFLAW